MVGDPAVLFNDLLSDPEKYEEGTDELLQQLLSGQKNLEDLDAQERYLLNHATISFVQAPRTKKTAPAPPTPKEVSQDLDESGAPLPADSETIELPEAPTFWWRR